LKPTDRPWLPMQLFGIAMLFGPLAGGVAAGLNFARLGRPGLRAGAIFAGVVLFAVEAAVLLFVPEQAARMVATLANLGIGLGFMVSQKPTFDEWKAERWEPAADEGERYRPNRVGLLFLVGFACGAVQFGVVFATLAMTGTL
jgi:hypothetical protein